MTLLGTSVLSALAVLAKLATSLFLSKVLAVYVGPAGYGIIGQFQSLISMVTTFASGATSNGVTKFTAEWAVIYRRATCGLGDRSNHGPDRCGGGRQRPSCPARAAGALAARR